jgi:hypothetical protein
MAGTVTTYFNKKALGDWLKHSTSGTNDGVASPGNLTARLYKTGFVWSPLAVLAQLVEADFVGYTAVTPIAWLTPYLSNSFQYTVDSQLMQFECTANTTPNTIHGWYISTTADGGQLLMGGEFDTPVPVGNVDNSIQLSVKLMMGVLGNLIADAAQV